ncbi:MAG: PH domain-containing protein [Pseudomonadota bacterium]|nr:PH domain-containing protein [Pseudomonadota bacterium]
MSPTTPEYGAERRLHPMSWLFVLLAQLRQFIVPLVALLFFGQRDEYALWPLVGVGALALLSVWQYFTYRYRIEDDSVVIRSGLLHRHLRQVPFARIHNVALHQNLLHRMFDVAEVRLESAGGDKPEAQMRVLHLSDAMALEQLVRRRGVLPAGGDGTTDAGEAPGRTLLQLPPMEVVRLGLVSNRGLLVLGGAAAAMSQFNQQLFADFFEGWGKALFGYADAHRFDASDYAIAGASLLLAFVLLLRALSVGLALLGYFGFRLDEHGRRLTVERGLLTRLRTSVPRRRIQAWTLEEGLTHRLLRRRSLRIDTASGGADSEQRALRELAPIAMPDACNDLVRHLLPGVQWPPAHWQPLHRLAWLRLAWPGAVLALVVCAALSWRGGAWAWLLLAVWLAWTLLAAHRHAHGAGYACDERMVAGRGGWWSRHWRFAEIDKLQALRLAQSPLDRRCGMATLVLDTAGASAMAPPLRLRYLREAEARELFERLGTAVAARKLRW